MSPLVELSLHGFLLLLRGFSTFASDLEDDDAANFYKNRQLYGQQAQSAGYGSSGSSYQSNAVYGSAASYQSSGNGAGGNTLMSREICKGRIGYVADTTRNCEVFYNCFADGTVTTSTCPGSYQFDETSQCCKMPHDVNCAGLLDGGVGTPRPAIECAGKRGFFADYTSNCQVFYFCEESGRSRQLTCPDGLIFNELIGCCDVAQNVRCGSGQVSGSFPTNTVNPQLPPSSTLPNSNNGNNPFCRNRPAGFYANLNDCSTYYYCQGGGYSGQTLHCPNGQAFNEVTSSCDNDLSRCYGTVVDSSVFDCSGRNGWYAGNDPECTTAYFCNNRVTYLHTCQQGLRWNPVTVDCGIAQQVQCRGGQPQVIYQPPLVPVTSRPADIPSEQYPPSSYGGGGGAQFIPQSPAQQPNLNITFSQGPNSNPDGPRTYPSMFPINGPGSGNGNGPNQNPGYIPSGPGFTHEQTPGYLPANPGNGYNQNPGLGDTTGDVDAHPGLGIDNSYDCSGKIGYYAIQEVGCAQFVYCSPEGIARKFDCPSTLLFNNSLAVCDWPQNVQCGNQPDPGFLPSTQNQPVFDCRGKDGFYADQSRGGRVFYLCHADGIKYQYVCPANLVFNERTSVCDWPDYMKESGFVEGSTNANGQGPSPQWIGEPLDCRLRPAGFYANPADNTIYARCTPDGTFVPMHCPQTTVFDQALGQCVFPFQLGQGQGQTPSSYEGRNPQIPTSVTTTSIYPRPTSTQGGIETTHYYQPNTMNTPSFAVQNGFYGQGGNTNNNNSPEGGQPNFAVQNGFYGQEGSGGPGLTNNEVPNYAVQSTFYGQAPTATHTLSNNNNNIPNSERPNYAVQNTFYGQTPGTNTQDNSNNHEGPNYAIQDGFYGVNQGSSQQGGQGSQPNNPNEHPTFLNQGNPQVPNYAVQNGPGYASFPQDIPDSHSPGSTGGGQNTINTNDGGQTYFRPQPTPGYIPQNNNVQYTNQYDHQNEHPTFLNQGNPQVYGNTNIQTNQQQPSGSSGGRPNGITIGITITNHGPASLPYGTTASPTTVVICLGRTGIFADRTSQCRSYTICRNDGVGETRTCPDNQVFNEQISACDNPQNTNCFFDSPGIVQPSVPVCLNGADRPNTFLPDITQSCTTFYSCEQNGQGTQFRCPPGLQFNSKINACDDPRSCNCVAGNGGTINIRIPVTTSQVIQSGEAYGPSYPSYQQDHGNNVSPGAPNQNMNLDITVHRTKVGEYMPLVRGYDEALYADASVPFGRLPTFYSDDENGSAILNTTDLANDITPPTSTLSAQEQLRAASKEEHAALMQMAAAESVRLFAKTRPSIPGVTNNSSVRMPDKPRSKFKELRLGRDPSRPFGGVLHALATANSRSMRRKFAR